MDRLAGVDELLDGPLDDLDELADNLRDLRRLNRVFGIRLSRRAIAHLVPEHEPLRLVDVGTGGADIPVALLANAARTGRDMCVTAMDSSIEVLAAARRARPAVGDLAGLELVHGEGTELPFPDGFYDVAHCSLVLHHLEPAAAAEMLREMARVARRGIVVNDLVRARLFVLGAWMLSHLASGNRLSHHDAPLSVRRAYSRPEMRRLFDEAGLHIVAEEGGFVGHRVAIAAVLK